MSCITCVYCIKFEKDRIRCWQGDGDHALVLTVEKAKKHKCYYYRNIKDKRCEDCKAFENGFYCMNVNNGKIKEGIFEPKSVADSTKACKYFQENKE